MQVQRNRRSLYLAALSVSFAAVSLPALAQNQRAQQNQRQEQQQQSQRQDQRRDNQQDRQGGNRESRAESSDKWQQKKMKPDELPGEIKKAVGKETGQDEKITSAMTLTRGDRTLYRVEVANKERSRAYTLDQSGKILDTDNTTEAGRAVADFATLPGEVKSRITQEAEGRPVKKVFQVTRDEETFYVAQIDAAEGLRTVRVGKNGDLLVAPRLMSERGDRSDANQGRDQNREREGARANGGREGRADMGRDSGDAAYEGWQRRETTFETLPGPVKQAIGREAGQDPVRNVVELSKDGRRVFRAEVVAAEGARSRVIRVDEKGEIIRERNTTDAGRQAVPYDTLPGEVKNTISKMTGGNQPKEVQQLTRGGDTFYSFEHQGKRVFVGKNGQQLTESELPRAGGADRR